MRQSWVSVWVILLLLGIADGYLYGMIHRCEFNSTDPEDIKYIQTFFYNKLEFLRFDSGVGWFVGYTEFGAKVAEIWNNDTVMINIMRKEKYLSCAPNIDTLYHSILSKSVVPYALITTVPSVGREMVLVCNVYSFFPKEINVTWTNHRKPIHSAVSYTDLLPNSDWTYQIHSTLEYSPSSGDKISCVIEHVSLKEPMVVDYDGAVSHWDRNRVIIGACGLVLGLLFPLAGFLFHKFKGVSKR